MKWKETLQQVKLHLLLKLQLRLKDKCLHDSTDVKKVDLQQIKKKSNKKQISGKNTFSASQRQFIPVYKS